MTTRILCSGTFDKLHEGHKEYFRQSKALAKDAELTVIVARDSNSKRIKGKPTINSEELRLKGISELEVVDQAVLGYEGERVIERVISLKPDIIALGHDQWAKEDWLKEELEKEGHIPKIVRMPKYNKDISPS